MELFEIGFTRKGESIRMRVGLAHVKATVERHRGEVAVSGELGAGTTFTIRLPIRC
jgi:signal transduction histidine kinase